MKAPERITVVLIPDGAGKTRQFHVHKQWLRRAVIAGAAFLGLTIASLAIWTGVLARSRVSHTVAEDELERLRRQNEQAQAELESLKRIHTAYVEETQTRVGRVEDVLGKMQDFTGIRLLTGDAGPVEGAALATSQTLDGRGGAANLLAGRIGVEALQSYDPEQLEAMERLIRQLDLYYENGTRALQTLKRRSLSLDRTPLILPVTGTVGFTDRFGSRAHPIFKRKDFHAGLDIAAPLGAPIVAPADGVVAEVASDNASGRYFEIDHGQGTVFDGDRGSRTVRYATRYLHCQKILVKKGQRVKRGEVIAHVGATGLSTGTHLHYEVHVDGRPVDPAHYILDRPPGR